MRTLVFAAVCLLPLTAGAQAAPTAKELLEQAQRKLEQDDPRGAVEACTAALKLAPKDAAAYSLRAEAKSDLADYAGAEADLTRALALDPKDTFAYVLRGQARVELSKLTEAIADYGRAIELDPKLAEAWLGRGDAREAAGQPKAAEADYARALTLAPDDAEAWLGRGRVRGQQGNLAGAEADLGKAIGLDATLAEAWLARGRLRLTLGKDPKPAIADLGRAIVLDRTASAPYLLRADARAWAGDLPGALEDAGKAVELEASPLALLTRARYRRLAGQAAAAKADLATLAAHEQLAPSDRVWIRALGGEVSLAVLATHTGPDGLAAKFLLGQATPEQLLATTDPRRLCRARCLLALRAGADAKAVKAHLQAAVGAAARETATWRWARAWLAACER